MKAGSIAGYLCVYCVLFFSVSLVYGNELGGFLRQAAESHPLLSAQFAVVDQYYYSHSELFEDLDPQLFASAGYGTALRGLPLSTAGYSRVGLHDSAEVSAGVMVPLEAGAYISAGGVARRWFEPDDGYDPMYQNLLGVNVTVPLWRDRGFAVLGWRRRAALAAFNAQVNTLMGLEMQVRRDVEIAYINACEAKAAYEVARGATERFRQLDIEARELAKMRTIPQYQVQETERDLQTGVENEEIAGNLLEVRMVELGSAIGTGEPPAELQCDLKAFLAAAADVADAGNTDFEAACLRRGEILSLQEQREEVFAHVQRYTEEQKDEVSLHLGATWQGDGDGSPVSAYRKVTEHNFGAEIMVTWTRPLDYSGSKARVQRYDARLKELDARIRHARALLMAELRSAEYNYASALKRLQMVGAAVKAAEATVLAERERFRLGEGSSGDVLDAQKSLTEILQRMTAATGALLRARVNLNYSRGYPDRIQEKP